MTNKENNKEFTFNPKKTLKEIKAVKWARWAAKDGENGLGKNLAETVAFTGVFVIFFQICSLIAAGFLKLLGI